MPSGSTYLPAGESVNVLVRCLPDPAQQQQQLEVSVEGGLRVHFTNGQEQVRFLLMLGRTAPVLS
jgi:hypothetical protein